MNHTTISAQRRAGSTVLGILILAWTLFPIYNMAMLAFSPSNEVFAKHLWPEHPSISAFITTIGQQQYYVSSFWRQLANSIFVGVIVTLLVLFVSTLASYVVSWQRPPWSSAMARIALTTYVIPMTFVAIPLYQVMSIYGLLNTQWSLIFGLTAFASPYGMWVLAQYSDSGMPRELDESAKIDGANPLQVYWHIYLPLLRPAMVAVGTYAFLLSWNEYLLAFLFLSQDQLYTLPVALGAFLNTDQPPWNVLMAASLLFSIPPIVIYYMFRKNVTSGLAEGGVKT